MKAKSKLILVGIILGLAVGCSKPMLTTEEYLQYVDDPNNGLITQQTVGDYSLGLQYRPAAYETIVQLGKDVQPEKATFQEALKEQRKLQYFILRIGSEDKKTDVLANGIDNQQSYYRRIEYLNSGIAKDIYLLDGEDTLHCATHHFERTFHMTYFNTVFLVFENPHPDEFRDKTLVFDDELFGMGKVKLKIDKSDIKTVPEIFLL